MFGGFATSTTFRTTRGASESSSRAFSAPWSGTPYRMRRATRAGAARRFSTSRVELLRSPPPPCKFALSKKGVVRINPEKKEDRERVARELLRVPLRLAAAHGFVSLGLREVSRAADIAPTSFYRHFAD